MAAAPTRLAQFSCSQEFIARHIGPSASETQAMLSHLGLASLSDLVEKTLPASIRAETTASLGSPRSETQALAELKAIAGQNQLFKSYIGLGYHPTYTPLVILRNVLENPGWYTAYTPYQPEIAQGRLEGLLNFQQMLMDLTGMEMANASMLDEATAAAEAMSMAKRVAKGNASNRFFVQKDTHPQTLAVVATRAEHFGFEIVQGELSELAQGDYFGALLSYPASSGALSDLRQPIQTIHAHHAIAIVAADLLSLVLLEAPGHLGADIVIGSNQRFGIPMGFGGPHAGFFAFRDEYKRQAPGRIIGVSIDKRGKPALRMAMQTREQHIRREKANSNICTSQVLLALMSAFYAIYHGPEGLKRIAGRTHLLTKMLAAGLTQAGLTLRHSQYFDTLVIETEQAWALIAKAAACGINLRPLDGAIGISLNETTEAADLIELLNLFGATTDLALLEQTAHSLNILGTEFSRQSTLLTHPVFNRYHSETEMLRYLKRLEARDIALNHAMIPLGSCTMKLNATAEMLPVTWPEFANLHPFAPIEQAQGFRTLFEQLEQMLQACTGYDAISLQPNAGSQGEYAGLVAVKKYFEARGEHQRRICLIPASAHGTNPASAQMVSMQVVVTACDDAGNVDLSDLHAKVALYGEQIAALMITYPSTHGVFEENIRDICELIHSIGAQVYIDGANMNALVGLAAPGQF
ncbi:MAG: hypothetical protein RL497_1641, partial [Pseudomonadota bacterium]